MLIDILLLIFAGWGFYQGYSRGIISTFFTVFSIIFGLVVAFKLAPAATRFLESLFKSDEALLFVAGFFLSFFLTMILIRMIARILENTLQRANVNVVNKMAGGILLSALYTLVFSLMVWFADKSHIVTPEVQEESKSYAFLKVFPNKMRTAYDYVKPSLKEFWQESVKLMDRMEENSMEKTESAPTIFDIPDEES